MDLRASFALDRIAACEARPDRLDPRRYAARDKARDGTFVHVQALEPTAVDRDDHAELVASVWIDGSERIVGMGSFFVEPWSEPRRAELAFSVADGWRERGIDTILLAHLERLAQACGVEKTLFGSSLVG